MVSLPRLCLMAVLLQARNTTAACFPLNLGTSNKGQSAKASGYEGEEQLSTLFLKLGLGDGCRSVLILSKLVVHSPFTLLQT